MGSSLNHFASGLYPRRGLTQTRFFPEPPSAPAAWRGRMETAGAGVAPGLVVDIDGEHNGESVGL